MNTYWLNDWKVGSESWKDKFELEAMLDDFNITADKIEGCTILLASYTYEDYSGEAFVLFEKGGKYYEVNGSHCSCHGLEAESYSGDSESQWQPEETSIAALEHRLNKGKLGIDWDKNTFANELRQVLDALKGE